MHVARTALFTIGYEGRALDELIAILAANRIERVIDVRELPLSRRRGFSKTPLGTALAGHRAALLCYEGDPAQCHRSLLAPRVAKRLGVTVRDL